MKLQFSKTVVAGVVAAVSMFASATAGAQNFPDFGVNPKGLEANVPGIAFTADRITGGYTEVVTFNPGGTFDVSLIWQAGQFLLPSGQVANTGLNLNLNPIGVPIDGYGLYATYKASGTYATVGTETVFTFLPSAIDSLKLYYDRDTNTTYNGAGPADGTGDFTLFNSADDFVIATGKPLTGNGELDPADCSAGGINCGSFGSSTTFTLNADGMKFFTSPVPFYSLSFQSGQLNNFDPSGRQLINGSLDVVFNNQVPEPASLGLLGLGLLGLGAVRRRKQAK